MPLGQCRSGVNISNSGHKIVRASEGLYGLGGKVAIGYIGFGDLAVKKYTIGAKNSG